MLTRILLLYYDIIVATCLYEKVASMLSRFMVRTKFYSTVNLYLNMNTSLSGCDKSIDKLVSYRMLKAHIVI